MLKFILNAEEHGKLSEAEKGFYKASGDNFQLEVDGAVDKTKLDEFRTTNVELLKSAEKYKGVDLEKVNLLLAQEAKLKDAEFIEKKDFEGLVESRTNAMRSDLEAKIQTLTEQNNLSGSKYNSLVSKHEIEGAAIKAFTEHKISPEAHEAVMSQIKGKFSIDNGVVVAKSGDTIEAGANGNLTVSEFVQSQPEIFKIQSNGGNGQGNDNNDTTMKKGNSSVDQIKEGLAARMSS